MAPMSDRPGDVSPFGAPERCSTGEGAGYPMHVIEGREHAIDGREIHTWVQMSS